MEELSRESCREFCFQGAYSESDLDAISRFVVSQSLDQRMGRITLISAGLVVLLAILLHSWLLAIGGFLGVVAISVLLRFVVLPKRLLHHARKLDRSSGLHTIRINGAEVHHTALNSESIYPLRTIRKAVLAPDHLFLLFRPQGLVAIPLAWILPVTSIEDVALLLARKEQ